ncbi:MAG: hypothetical protein KGY67_00510 [Candidatus Thermoplasmatota archaeon]|nr:hypothetical protein [Candidatus Thermoplasmatota archaeon]
MSDNDLSELFGDSESDYIEPSSMCILLPDGSIANVNAINYRWKNDREMREIFGNVNNMLKDTQLGVCVESTFTPISEMLTFEHRNIAKQVIQMGKKNRRY